MFPLNGVHLPATLVMMDALSIGAMGVMEDMEDTEDTAFQGVSGAVAGGMEEDLDVVGEDLEVDDGGDVN